MPISRTLQARDFAVAAHGAQRYGEHPYVHHLDAVAELAAPYGEEAVVLAYLHDTVEDTEATLADVAAAFGADTADCVGLLSDAPGATRKERKAQTYARMAQVQGPPLQLALLVKAADRLANVRACLNDRRRELWTTYHGEHPTFRASAWRAGLCDPLWAELDALLADGAFDAFDASAP